MATPPKKTGTGRPRATGNRSTGARRATAASTSSTTARKRTSNRGSAKRQDRSSHFSTALIVGAVAAVGAIATGALLALRGSSLSDYGLDFINGGGGSDDDDDEVGAPDFAGGSAHQPDGEDASASFRAGIADENTIPDRVVPQPG